MKFLNEQTTEIIEVEMLDTNGIDNSRDLITDYNDRYDGEYYALSDREFERLIEFVREGQENEENGILGDNEYSIFNNVDAVLTPLGSLHNCAYYAVDYTDAPYLVVSDITGVQTYYEKPGLAFPRVNDKAEIEKLLREAVVNEPDGRRTLSESLIDFDVEASLVCDEIEFGKEVG